MGKATPGPWTANIARLQPDAPPFGFTITVEGKVPYLASAGVATNDHALIVDKQFRAAVTTGFTEEEVEANAYLLAAAPDLLAACKESLDFHEATFATVGSGDYETEEQADIASMLKAAIAKAEDRP